MSTRCSSCGSTIPRSAFFCTVCGAVQPHDGGGPQIRPIQVLPREEPLLASPSIDLGYDRSRPAREAPIDWRVVWREALIFFGGFVFAIVFLVGLKLFLEMGGVPVLGIWPVGLLAGGALFAQQSWINGKLWAGLRGMLLWSGATWLVAAGRAVPWVLLLVAFWVMTRPRWYHR